MLVSAWFSRRLPLPWPVLDALAVIPVHLKFPEMALACLLAADAFPWPGELCWIKAVDVVEDRPGLDKSLGLVTLLVSPMELVLNGYVFRLARFRCREHCVALELASTNRRHMKP